MLTQSMLAVTAESPVASRVLQGVFAQASGSGGPLGSIAMMAVLAVVLYLFLIRPQSKQQKEHKAMIASLKKGDAVITGGGIVGKIHAVAEKTVLVEVAQGVRLRMLTSSVSSKVPEGMAAEEEAKSDGKGEKAEKDDKK